MIAVSQFADRPVSVIGLGRSGLATADALACGGARVWAWDDNEKARNEAAKKGIPLCEPASAPIGESAALILSPGIPLTHPAPHPVVALAHEAGCPIVGDIELLYGAQPQATYVGITGTNGKSTTTALVGHILEAAGKRVETGGNLGAPALGLAPLAAGEIYVLELSSYQLDLLDEAVFDIAVLINIAPDHLDRHGGMDGYVAAKTRIFADGDTGAVAIVGVDDDRSAGILAGLRGKSARRVIGISARGPVPGGVYVRDGTLFDDLDGTAERALDLTGIPTLPGEHNWQNAAAGYAAARAVGIPREIIAKAIAGYPGLAHRQERAGVVDGVTYVNDSKATNIDATVRALACYDSVYWIAGGLAKEGGLAGVGTYLSRVRHAFLIGDAMEAFAETLTGKVALTRSETLEAAVGQAHEAALRDGIEDAVVLLSPACASFDQFANFGARGDAFKALVAGLPGQRRAGA